MEFFCILMFYIFDYTDSIVYNLEKWNRREMILKKNILNLFLEKLLAFPLWVKQVIYLRLYQNLQSHLSEDFITTKQEDIFHLYIPPLTFAGKTEFEERKGNHDNNIYVFLSNVVEGLAMLEIAMNNFWTMEEVAKCYIFCLEQNYVKTPESAYVGAMAGFMSGKYRTGEYFKRIGRINVDQLEQVLITQKEMTKSANPKKMAEIMIDLGFITEKETQSLLQLKEESKKRFILEASLIPKEAQSIPASCNEQIYKDQISKLTEQNTLLKEQLRKILAYVKKTNG